MTSKSLPPRDKSGRFIPAGQSGGTPIDPIDSTSSATKDTSNAQAIPAHATSPAGSAVSNGSASPTHSTSHACNTLYARLGFDRPRSPSPLKTPVLSQDEYNNQGASSSWQNCLKMTSRLACVTSWPRPAYLTNSPPRNTRLCPPPILEQPPPLMAAECNTTIFPIPHSPVSSMSHSSSTGLAAMPAARSQRAPCFSGQDDEILAEFLREYEDLADGNGLLERLKVETVLCYIPRSLRNLWMTLPGYRSASWHRFRTQLEELYPDIAATKCRVRDEGDVLKYYQNFLTIALPLLEDDKLTDDDFNAEFFKGFHLDDQDTLADQVFNINPRHPANRPFDIQDVLSAARQYFACDRFHKPLQRRIRNDLCGCSKTHRGDPKKLIQRLFGDKRTPKAATRDDNSESEQEDDDTPAPERPTYETWSVRFKDPSLAWSQTNEEDDSLALVTKLQSLSVHEPSYLMLYSQCQERFPSIAQHLPKPELFPSKAPSITATVAYQSPPAPPCQPWAQRAPAPPAPSSVATVADKDIFFSDRNAAEEYVDTGRVKIVNNRLFLPTGQPIPNDGHGLGLQASIDAWLSANVQSSSDTATPTLQRDAPPHTTSYSFEIVPEPVVSTGAYITEEVDSDTGDSDKNYTTDFYDMYEVFSTKKKDSRPFKPATTPTNPPSPPPAPVAPSATSTSTSRVPQYRYQATAEDQALTKELLGWILEGKLDKATPAHILAASPLVRKELVEHLKPRRVETASFEQVDNDSSDPVTVVTDWPRH
ncbi:hypothetical protein BJY52DRAFT_1196292 [Lactarius psammicola]|nr:hypothetical protein BJY52DRAFT_1196292 [Lactarius psammicola]